MVEKVPLSKYPIELYRYRFEYRTDSDFYSPPFLGSYLRGTFGMVFRELACTTKMSSCFGCPKIEECSYQMVFESANTGSAPLYIGNVGKLPHPFIIHAPWGKPIHYAAGSTFSFGITLMGSAKKYLPLLVYAFKVMGEKGLGRSRYKLLLSRIYNTHGKSKSIQCYDSSDDLLNTINEPIDYSDYEELLQEPRRIEMYFRTPMRIQQNNHALTDPQEVSAGLIIRAAQRRYHTLHHFYGVGDPIDHLPEVEETHISCDAEGLQYKANPRYSGRSKTEMDLGGFIGRVILGGDIEEWLPYLYMSKFINLGKNTAFGLGEVVII